MIADADNSTVRSTITAEEFGRLPYAAYSGGPLPSIAESQLGVLPQAEVNTQSFLYRPVAGDRYADRVAGSGSGWPTKSPTGHV